MGQAQTWREAAEEKAARWLSGGVDHDGKQDQGKEKMHQEKGQPEKSTSKRKKKKKANSNKTKNKPIKGGRRESWWSRCCPEERVKRQRARCRAEEAPGK